MGLIELLKDFTDSQNDNELKQNALLERCLNTSISDLEGLSKLLNSSPNTHLPTLQTFMSRLCNKNSRTVSTRIKKQNSKLSDFTLLLITIIIMENLHHSDIPTFREFLQKCIELLWLIGNKDTNKLNQELKNIFSKILDAHGVLVVFVSDNSGHLCIKRMLFEFKIIGQIEQEKLLKAVDVVAALVRKCSEHKKDLPKCLSEYEACTALLKTLKSRHEEFGTRWNKVPLSAKDKQHIALLNVVIPQRSSDLPHFLKALERQKIDLLQNLMEYLPCASCYEQALVSFSPDKYFLEEESVPSFRLPFEFNEDDELGPWDVLLSDDTIEDMKSLVYGVYDEVEAVMKKLSFGAWGKHKLQGMAWNKYQLGHTVQTCAIPVYEVELPNNGGLKILWSVDYGFSIRSGSLTQLVKIWAVTTDQKQIHKILQNLSIVHQVYTSKQSHRCIVRQIGKDDQIDPMILGDEEETKSSENSKIDDQDHNVDVDRLLEVHKMLVTNKFVPFSKNLLNSLVLGGLKFTFQISKMEYEIINSSTSSIIIGRSGTGKTTCIVFRLITSYLNKRLCKTPSLCDNNKKRQIFITVSPNLCHRVKDYFYQLRESAMLAGKEMTAEQRQKYKQKKEEEGTTNNILLEEREENQNVPNTFHQLADHHFPLFITYDKFSKMLLETYDINSQNLTVQKKLHRNNVDSYDDDNQNSYNKHFVNYKVFQKRYWPSLNEYCKKKFDCGLVYSEFSIIKGSNPDADYLSKKDYRDVSIKKYPVFSYNRDQIYDLFLQYEKLKSRNGDYDSMDRTSAILRCAKTKALGGPHIHEVYIDECQDNQIVDLALILKVFDRADNIFFAGDIAQCIARGSSFRFQDLSALIYQWENTRQANRSQHSIKPKQFELNVNYRCHNGILQLASSVIDLIRRFFPDSIDRLSRERGEVIGPLPIIFDGFQKYHFKVFSMDENTANYVEFGSEQVIIVRDDETKLHLEKLIGRAGMVMTIFEAKGMEFNDVLLYNFFTKSPACQKWRVIHSAISENSKGIQSFSHEKHYILSSELKHLYVAITRARQRFWICDEDVEYSMPIRMYWNNLGLVKVVQSEDEFLSTLANRSSPHEWDRKGKEFFEQQQYKQAIFCFKKSGNDENYKLANAYYLRQIARDSRDESDKNIIKSNFIYAAQAFLECSQPKQAALCYQEIGMIEEAIKVYVDWDLFEPAAHCYLKIETWHEAGKYFAKAKKYVDAAFAYIRGGLYCTSINLIQQYRQEIEEDMFYRIIKLIKDHYREIAISHGKFEEAIDIFMRLIDNDDDVIETLQFLLYLCGIDILKKTMTDDKGPNVSQELFFKKGEIIIAKFKSESSEKCYQWKIVMEKFQLYIAYFKKDFNRIHECIQFFRSRREFVNEFHAIIIWLHFPQSDIQAKYWHDRLQFLLKLCELSFPFINLYQNFEKTKIHNDFDDIFFINEVEDDSRKRKIPFDNLLIDIMRNKNKKSNAEEMYIYDVKDVHHEISQFLASYIFDLIQDADKRGRNIPDISFQICDNFASCEKLSCQKHHVIPTPLILYKRLTFACLQYTVMQQLDVLSRKLLKDSCKVQSWWVEKLVVTHICYQSSQTSCPEIIYIVLAKLPRHIRDGFINIAHKIWLLNKSKNGNDFADILKCMFVFQQLQDKTNINKFYLEMSKITMLSHPINLPNSPIDSAISVEKRLSLFFFFLYSNQVIRAISHLQYIINIQLNNPITFNTFGDIASLMEFKISLVFATGPGYCDFCLPRAYLVNYFEAFTAKPLSISNKSNYSSNENYLAAIKNSFDQVQHLLDLLISKKKAYFTIILRLIRLLVLIGLNESTFALKVCNLFKRLNNQVSSIKTDGIFSVKIKKYLQKKDMKGKDTKEEEEDIEDDMDMEEKDVEERDMEYLVNILHNDLKETGCDSLIIVHNYQQEGLSRFSNLEKYGIMKLLYNSIEEFHSALQQIILSVINEQVAVSEESQALITEIQAWFQSRKAERVENAAKKIQTWFRQNQKKSNSILNRVYNEMIVFCQAIMKEKEREAVYKYNILLRGRTVDVIVELTELQSKMDVNNLNFDDDAYDYCDYCEKVNLVLESLSVTKNLAKHKKVNIEWLEIELEWAKGVIEQVREWIDKFKIKIIG